GAGAGRDEHQALDVVEMVGCEQDVDVRRVGQAQPQVSDARAGVEDELLAAVQDELNRRGVAAVAVHLRPWSRNRAASSPDLDPHRPRSPSSLFPIGQNRIIAPEEPSSEATIGKALDSISCSAPLAERIRNTPWAGRPLRIAWV